MDRISKTSPLSNQAAHLTTFDNGKYEASLDAVYVKNLMTSKVLTESNTLSDHKYVWAEFNIIITEKPE